MNNDNLDEFIRQGVRRAEVPPPLGLFEDIQRKRKKRKIPVWWSVAAAVATLLLALPVVIPRETTTEPGGHITYTPREIPPVLMEDTILEEDPVTEVEEAPEELQQVQHRTAMTAPVKKSTEISVRPDLDYIDSLENAMREQKALIAFEREMQAYAESLVNRRIALIEVEALSEEVFFETEHIALENERSSEILPLIRRFFHPDYHLSIEKVDIPWPNLNRKKENNDK
jgi:hypothetical protein